MNTHDRIGELATLIAARVPELIDEARDQINDAITAAMEDSQDAQEAGKEGKAILSLSISVKWDLDGNSVVIAMPVNVRRKFECVSNLDDPNQTELPIAKPTERAFKKLAAVLRENNATVTAGS